MLARNLLAASKSTATPVDTTWDTDASALTLFTDTPQNWFLVSTQESSPEDIFFKSDGTKFYIVGTSGEDVNEYNLSTAWDITTASYNQNFSVSTQETQPTGISFKSDGTKMFIIGKSGDDVNEYTLSTAWDISTASYSQNFSVSSQNNAPEGLAFKSDGTEMYMLGSDRYVYQYNLTTGWDVSTASYDQNFNVGSGLKSFSPKGIRFKSDGTEMYITDAYDRDIDQYTLSTAWDISTASYSSSFGVRPFDTNPTGVFFKSDGTKAYIVGKSKDAVWQFSLSTAWDISTASFAFPAKDYYDYETPTSLNLSGYGIHFKPDGTRMYIVDDSFNAIFEYSLSTAWEVSSASYVRNRGVGSEETFPHSVFFKPDGTKMFVTGPSSDEVQEYALSTAWDISTETHTRSLDVSSQGTIPRGLFFKSDGTKMYVLDTGDKEVNEYDLSTAWDLSSASFNQSFSDTFRMGFTYSLFFKADGTRMYAMNTNSILYEWGLSTAWDVSTASLNHSGFSYSFFANSSRGIYFKPDGTKFWITDNTLETVHGFTLSPR